MGCATLPHVAIDATGPPPSSVAPQTTDGKRILRPAEAASVVPKLDAQARSDLLARHLALVESHVREPLVVGNRSRLLIDGPQTHEAMFAAIESAQRTIELETYILESRKVGERLAELLCSRRRQDVQVRVLSDAVGSFNTDAEYFARLKADGIAIRAFNPVEPLRGHPELALNNRDHRKILVADRRVAFTGGINISGVYSSGSFRSGRARPAEDRKKDDWRSFAHNFEVNVVTLGPALANRLRALYERDLADSHEITAGAWSKRSVGSRTKEAFSRLWANYL